MDLDRTPAQLAADAAEAVRALNHRTFKPDAFPNPADVSDAAVGIARVVERLPQALRQLEAGLQALYEDDRIRLAGRDPRSVSQADILHAVSDARFGLQEGREALERMQEYLRQATGVLGGLGAPWPEDDDGEG